MSFFRISKQSFLILAFLLSALLVHAQKSTQKQLEEKKADIKKELKEINALLFTNKQTKAAVFSDVENLSYKIERKQELIKLTNQQINLLNQEIEDNSKFIEKLEKDLFEVKEAYKEMILKSFKSKSGKNRLMFILSSETFFQAFKRTQYIKQYSLFRKNQAKKIGLISAELKEIKKELLYKRDLKQGLLTKNRSTQKTLESEKKEAKNIISKLRNKEKKYKRNIIAKEKESQKIDKQIDKLIREAIARSNKNKSSKNSKGFNLTPEAKALAKKFELNKGKLPWPVSRGVVIQKFGTQPHPVVKTAKIKSNGIVIATEKSQKVKTVFEGSVLSVLQFRGSNPTVLVQHGNYITAYKNLSKVFVSKGDKVSSNQYIGEVFTNSSTGKSSIQFSIFQKTTPLNPLLWILKMN
ncbi:peptidoglycan DD-metalloendopeptidase family protein [Flavobacteriaceae bacterium]|nr:peptidoglycan DD-metalloendopeptidase family protein [Flavobacteriaceae bacterium]MDA9124618.1 peptidoglycan DD-metalloendopeptidase family protein [Flavobacteriaceae bacterium]MDA9338590.1 peptidoglycan DD-metalloendopeptidase family protein [Flavobacteriaceae bacterium]MDB4113351.1 peptidoglycan DD-metalloendopeptidase family protein [Flavobacteriaceae bacterium]MDC0116489.1 peptidoglycan DD-metalloendopeptidase family protein [Flavobacteriaceae bacterium]|tara:strand:- start:2550 stop:3779 length:1230 start_codon:yes stop_codon:yes gene_type:complete